MFVVPTMPVADTPIGVTLHAPLTVGLTNGSDARKLANPGAENLLSVWVLEVPIADVAATPVTVTFASPSTSTDTEPKSSHATRDIGNRLTVHTDSANG
jgi:hypothetical protein